MLAALLRRTLVRFTAWTGGHLRHSIFLGMREEKPARTVRRETPVEK
jgi:hypothetical protein